MSEIVFRQLKNLSPRLIYHNADHTRSVVRHAEEIFRAEKLSSIPELYILKTAALFHDTGFLKTYEGHEEESIVNASDVLNSIGIKHSEISGIQGLIMATRLPQNPQTHLERILCDADVYYLGTDEFDKDSEKLFEEWKNFRIISARAEFNQVQVHFLKEHHYFTDSAKRLLKKKKTENLRKILDKVEHGSQSF